MVPPEKPPMDRPAAWNHPLVDTGAEQPLTFGDTVRVRSTAEAEAAGIAGLVGRVVGETVPSMSGQEVALTCRIDYALGVHLPELDRTVFLPHDALEFIDHGPGQSMRLKTKQGWKTWVRLESGDWKELHEPAGPPVPEEVHPEPEPASFLARLLKAVRRRP